MSLNNLLKTDSSKAVLAISALGAGGLSVVGPAYAQDTSSGDEIVVTARKRAETLQDVPGSISAYSADSLKDRQVNDVTDLQVIEPTLTVGEAVGILKLNMRGLGNTSVLKGEDGEVSFNVDGAVVSRLEVQSLAFFDIDRVEVLRGPQGTLYGRNSTAGAINLITNKPTEEYEGYINVKAGNYNLVDVEAAVGGGLTDSLSWRGAFKTISRGGFAKNITTGDDINDEKRTAGRLQVLWKLNEDMDLLLSGEYANQNDASERSGFLAVQFPDDQADPLLAAPGFGGFPDPDSRDSAGDFTNQLKRETWSTTATFNWRIDESWSVKNIFNYRGMSFYNRHDLDISSVVSSNAIDFSIDGEHFSEEFQLAYDGDLFGNHLTGLVGFYYFNEDLTADITIGDYIGAVPNVGLPAWGKTDAKAAFWNVQYDLGSLVSLRAGGRYTDETREIDNDLALPMIPFVITALPSDDKKTSSDYTQEYGIDFNFVENTKLYFTYSEGFRAGAGLLNNLDSPIVEPTTAESKEIGLKGQYFDGQLTLNVAAYDTDVTNLQRTQVLAAPGSPGFVFLFRNAAGAMIRGVEFDSTLAVADALRFRGAFSYVDAKFTEFLTVDPLTTESVTGPFLPEDVAGNRPRLIPKWSGTLQGEYDYALSGGAVVTSRVGLSYAGSVFFDEFNRAPLSEDNYVRLDASLSYVPSSGNWSVTLWGKNLTDEQKIADAGLVGSTRTISKIFIKPRQYGVTASYSF